MQIECSINSQSSHFTISVAREKKTIHYYYYIISGFEQRIGDKNWTEDGRNHFWNSAGPAERARWRPGQRARRQRGITVSDVRLRSLFGPVPAQAHRAGLVQSAA